MGPFENNVASAKAAGFRASTSDITQSVGHSDGIAEKAVQEVHRLYEHFIFKLSLY
jgi:hypothetical protein